MKKNRAVSVLTALLFMASILPGAAAGGEAGKLPSSFDLRSVDTDGDGMHNIRLDSSVDIYAGGTTFMATNSYAAGIGPVCESRGTEFEYRGKEGKITKETAPDGTEYDYCYDRNDDWTMDGNHRFKQDYILKESYLLPQTGIYTEDIK